MCNRTTDFQYTSVRQPLLTPVQSTHMASQYLFHFKKVTDTFKLCEAFDVSPSGYYDWLDRRYYDRKSIHIVMSLQA